MKAELIRTYTKMNKENQKVIRYTYAVGEINMSDKEDREKFAESQGDFLRTHDDGRYLWFSDKIGVENVEFTSKGKPYGDTSSVDSMVQQIEQLPEGALKNAMAQELAKRLMGDFGKKKTTPVQESVQSDADDLGSL
jgi:hypothetical protein